MKSPVLLLILLAGCSGSPTVVPFLDRVMTVAEFTAAPGVRAKVSAFCGNDPGRTMMDPNCLNAQQAVHLANSGTGNFPKIDTSSPYDSK